MKQIEPITPEEVLKRGKLIPNEVFEIVNTMLVEKITPSKQIVVYTKDIANLVSKKLGISTDKVFEMHMLDIEDDYRKAGWECVYESPGFGDTFSAFFRFRIKDIK